MLENIMGMMDLIERGAVTAIHSAPAHIDDIIEDLGLEGTKHETALRTASRFIRGYTDKDADVREADHIHDCQRDWEEAEEGVEWYCMVAEILAVDTYVQSDLMGFEEGQKIEGVEDVPSSVIGLAFCVDLIYRYHQMMEEGAQVAEHLMDSMIEAQTQDQPVN